MRLRSIAVAAALSLTAAFGALAQGNGQHPNNSHLIDYKPVACLKAGELPLLQMSVGVEGELRAYFRRINTTDWCSVMGVNEGPLSRVILPKFDNGDEIEYFLVVIQGRRVVSRSQRIYRAAVGGDCNTMWARNVLKMSVSCAEEPQGRGLRAQSATAEADPIDAGDAIPDDIVIVPPGCVSCFDPNQSGNNGGQ